MSWLSKNSQFWGKVSQGLFLFCQNGAIQEMWLVVGDVASPTRCPSPWLTPLRSTAGRHPVGSALPLSDIRSESWNPLAFQGSGWHYPRSLQIFNRLTFRIICINQSDGGAWSCWVGEMIIEKRKRHFMFLLMSEISKFWKGSEKLCGRNLLRERAAVVPLSCTPVINCWGNVSKTPIMCTLKPNM